MAVSTGLIRAGDLLDLARRLRHALPSQAPMDIAEQIQHAIVRLETMAAGGDPLPDGAASAHAIADALLRTCASLFPSDRPRKI